MALTMQKLSDNLHYLTHVSGHEASIYELESGYCHIVMYPNGRLDSSYCLGVLPTLAESQAAVETELAKLAAS